TDISELDPNERARLGLFLAFQYPVVIPGVRVADFLRHAMSNVRNPDRKEGEKLIPMREFRKELRDQMSELGMDLEMARRYLNDGFSGGEKKRMEILQLAMLKPKFAVLDETDSGLDSDAVKVVSEGLSRLSGPEMGVLIITHHERLLEFNQPQFTHVMLAGRIVETGDASLAAELHEHGYSSVRERHPDAAAEEVVEAV
ncbi:MAG: Fe-S cluster assembly ATPase SufC, partial [Planctomycetaceae bacterium]|nr:Fe-S cluster assembly ATPase SufC [Planctomycetaceae bacterium]